MATNFPGSLDAFTNPTSGDTLDNPPHDQQHADVNDAVEAIETALLDGAPLHIDDANERVGIGTATPTKKLEISDSTEASILLDDTGGTVGGATNSRVIIYAGGVEAGSMGFPATGGGLMQIENRNGGLYLETDSAHDIDLRTNGSTRMSVKSDGKVGINDTSPSYTLDVNGDINATGDLRIGGTAIGERQSYTPTITSGGSLGNGTITGQYVLIQNFVMFFVNFTLGSTSSITGDLVISAPPGLSFGANDITSATAMYTDVSSGVQYLGAVRPYLSNLYCRLLLDDHGGGSQYVNPSASLSSTVPFTWNTGDIMAASGITVLA